MLVISIFCFSYNVFKSFSKQNFDSSRQEEFADGNIEFDQNREFSKKVENTVGKEEIVWYLQFQLIPQSFQKNCTTDS